MRLSVIASFCFSLRRAALCNAACRRSDLWRRCCVAMDWHACSCTGAHLYWDYAYLCMFCEPCAYGTSQQVAYFGLSCCMERPLISVPVLLAFTSARFARVLLVFGAAFHDQLACHASFEGGASWRFFCRCTCATFLWGAALFPRLAATVFARLCPCCAPCQLYYVRTRYCSCTRPLCSFDLLFWF